MSLTVGGTGRGRGPPPEGPGARPAPRLCGSLHSRALEALGRGG